MQALVCTTWCSITPGPVKELMKCCLSMQDEEGYAESKRLLKERYGQDYRIAAALVQKTIQIFSCVNTLIEIGYISKLYNPELKWRHTIIDREQWEVTVTDRYWYKYHVKSPIVRKFSKIYQNITKNISGKIL